MNPHGPFLIACAGLLMLSTPLAPGADPATPGDPLAHTKEQVEKLEAKAATGDYGACLELTDYLYLENADPLGAAHWWKVLVDHGCVEAIVQVGVYLMYAGDFDDADKWMRRAKENGDDFADECLKQLAEARVKPRRDRRPAPTAKELADAGLGPEASEPPGGPKDAAGYNARAQSRIDKDDLPGAIADTDRALELDPKNATAYFLRARAKESEGNLEAAIADFTRTIELNPKDSVAYSYRGFAHGTLRQTDALLADEDKALSIDPKNANAWCLRGGARLDKGDPAGAIADETRAIELSPKYAVAYQDRGQARARMGDRAGALADYNHAVELDPEYPAFRVDRGGVETMLRDWKAALADYRKACAAYRPGLMRDYPQFLVWLLRARLGETDAASEELSAYLEGRKDTDAKDWPSKIGEFLLGKIDETAFIAAAASPEADTERGQHCEAWYYAGMKKLLAGDKTAAADDFKKCLATGQKDYTEYQLAEAEMEGMRH